MLLIACNDEITYNVPDVFQTYVDRFVTEAAKRGKIINIREEGLIIEFKELENNYAGLCHYENPIRIEIDKSYWDEVGETAGGDLMHEDVIFHEMGHGILRRNHENAVLPNGEWKSIMCGGEQVNNRPWNINYRAMRRDYYLNELFNSKTTAPSFSGLTLEADTSGYTNKVRLNFDSEAPAQAGWNIGNFEKYTTSIDNGKLKFVSKINSTYLVVALKPIDVQSDFLFEFSIKSGSENASTDRFGMAYGRMDATNESIEFFILNKQKHFYTGNFNWFSYYTELTDVGIQTDEYNQLKVIKNGTVLYYFINNKYLYQDNMETISSGKHFGFIVPANGTVWLENLRIGIKDNSSSVKLKSLENDLQFETYPVHFSVGEIKK